MKKPVPLQLTNGSDLGQKKSSPTTLEERGVMDPILAKLAEAIGDDDHPFTLEEVIERMDE